MLANLRTTHKSNNVPHVKLANTFDLLVRPGVAAHLTRFLTKPTEEGASLCKPNY